MITRRNNAASTGGLETRQKFVSKGVEPRVGRLRAVIVETTGRRNELPTGAGHVRATPAGFQWIVGDPASCYSRDQKLCESCRRISFDGNRFRQISRLVDIRSSGHCRMVRELLHRNCVDDRRDCRFDGRHDNHSRIGSADDFRAS